MRCSGNARDNLFRSPIRSKIERILENKAIHVDEDCSSMLPMQAGFRAAKLFFRDL